MKDVDNYTRSVTVSSLEPFGETKSRLTNLDGTISSSSISRERLATA